LLALCLALTVWWTAAALDRMPLRASHLALSPVVALAALVAPDLVGVAFTAAALCGWSKGRLRWAGVWLGLAISTVHYPVLVLIAICFVAVRAGRWADARVVVGSALVTFGLVLASWRGGIRPVRCSPMSGGSRRRRVSDPLGWRRNWPARHCRPWR
jgi:uncharacterized membrane protein